jgi:spore coat protein U-like protein
VRLLALSLGVWLASCLWLGRAEAQSRCTIITTTAVSFGAYHPFDDRPLDSAGMLTLECAEVPAGSSLRITISRGQSGSFSPRRLRFRNHALLYNLFLDAARSMIWGDGTGGSAVYTARAPAGRPLSIPIFGRIPPRQNVAPGTYTDRLILTVNY